MLKPRFSHHIKSKRSSLPLHFSHTDVHLQTKWQKQMISLPTLARTMHRIKVWTYRVNGFGVILCIWLSRPHGNWRNRDKRRCVTPKSTSTRLVSSYTFDGWLEWKSNCSHKTYSQHFFLSRLTIDATIEYTKRANKTQHKICYP